MNGIELLMQYRSEALARGDTSLAKEIAEAIHALHLSQSDQGTLLSQDMACEELGL